MTSATPNILTGRPDNAADQHPNTDNAEARMENCLRELRARHRINQTYLGLLLGTSRQAISQIEAGNTKPTLDLALRLACLFRMPVEAIFPNPYQLLPADPADGPAPSMRVVVRRPR